MSSDVPGSLSTAGAVITESHLEGSGERVLVRLGVRASAVLDVLTDEPTLARCRELLRPPHAPGLTEFRLGSFGPFDVTLSAAGDGAEVAVIVDGPDLGGEFRGGQSAGVYVPREELLAALGGEPGRAGFRAPSGARPG